MGETDRYPEYKRPKNRLTLGSDGNALVALFTINVIFFLLLITIQVVYFFFQASQGEFFAQVLPYFQMPAQLTLLSPCWVQMPLPWPLQLLPLCWLLIFVFSKI